MFWVAAPDINSNILYSETKPKIYFPIYILIVVLYNFLYLATNIFVYLFIYNIM